LNIPSTAAWARRGRFLGERAPRVLLADDDEDLREELASALAEDGFEVVQASDGNQLLEAVVKALTDDGGHTVYDAIVTDVAMPGFSGIDVLTAMRTRTARIPVLVITGFSDERTLNKAASLGAVAVFRKPFELDDFRTALVNALGRPRRT
jgi:two-component system response regulator (stage 0 sporulation protein F)